MARMTRKEKIWEGFAMNLAEKIAAKFFEESTHQRKVRLAELEDEVIRKYYNPIKKILDKLPDGAVAEETHVGCCVDKVPDDAGKQWYRGVSVKLPERGRVPAKLFIPFDMVQELNRLDPNAYEYRNQRQNLYNDLVNNICVAESFEEVVTKWPEAKELAEEVSLTYATRMNVPLEKILGRYAQAALPAPATKAIAAK